MQTRIRRETRRAILLGLYSLLLAVPVACSPREALETARGQWQAQDVSHYRMEVRHISSVWHAQTYSIEVKDGEITHSAVCTPAPTESGACEVEDYDPADYTVEGLFEMAEWVIEHQDLQFVRLELDDEYGYPGVVAFDDPNLIDEDFSIAVISFEALEVGY